MTPTCMGAEGCSALVQPPPALLDCVHRSPRQSKKAPAWSTGAEAGWCRFHASCTVLSFDLPAVYASIAGSLPRALPCTLGVHSRSHGLSALFLWSALRCALRLAHETHPPHTQMRLDREPSTHAMQCRQRHGGYKTGPAEGPHASPNSKKHTESQGRPRGSGRGAEPTPNAPCFEPKPSPWNEQQAAPQRQDYSESIGI